MITKSNKNIKIWQEFNPFELSLDTNLFNSFDSKCILAKLGFNKVVLQLIIVGLML